MAKQHFLQANFTGSLGMVTGQRLKGQNVLKRKKYTKCHNGTKSNNAYYSFCNLHRLCCRVAPALTDTIFSKVKRMELIPKLEGLWKGWIENQQFPWDGIKKVAATTLPYTIENVQYSDFTTAVSFDIAGTVVLPLTETATMMFIIHNEVGQVFAIHFYDYKNAPIIIQLAGVVEHLLYVSSIVLHYRNSKWHFVSPDAVPLQ